MHRDLATAERFYGRLFGWEFDTRATATSEQASAVYSAATRDDRMVAGIAASEQAPDDPLWLTHIAVASLETAIDRIAKAGGTVFTDPIDVQPAGRWALVGDPSGAKFSIWEGHQHEGAELVNENWCWVLSTLHTSECESAESFYATVFGWTYDRVSTPAGDLTLCRLPNYIGGRDDQPAPRDTCAIMLSLETAPITGDVTGPRWMPEFWVDSLATAATNAEESGGRVIDAAYRRPGFTPALLLADPGGAIFVTSSSSE
jgi:uncharacterized protein